MATSLGDLLGDGHTRIAAGSGAAGMNYIYDAGAQTWGASPNAWLTPRGNFARTGSRLGAPPLSAFDDIPPAAITDLAVAWAAPDSVVLSWTAPGGDGASGQASAYELRTSTSLVAAANFAAGYRSDLAPPDVAGTPQRFAFRVSGGVPLYCVIRARDAAGNRGATSNIAALLTPLGGPYSVSGLAVAVAGDSSVMLRWPSPGAGVAGYDVRGARTPLDAISFESAPLKLSHAPACGRERFAAGALARCRHALVVRDARDRRGGPRRPAFERGRCGDSGGRRAARTCGRRARGARAAEPRAGAIRVAGRGGGPAGEHRSVRHERAPAAPLDARSDSARGRAGMERPG